MKTGKFKFILFSIAFAFFAAIFLVSPASAGMVLTEGEFVVVGTDPSAEDHFNQLMFEEMTLKIDDQGKVSGSANKDFSDLEWKGALFSGSVTLNMEGNYDTKENKLSGNFSVKHATSMKNEKAPPIASFYNDDVMTFEGTFSGGWSSENGAFEINFSGTKRSVGKTESSNGKVDEYDRSTKWSNKVLFREDLCDSLIAKAKQQKNWHFIQTANAKDSGARFTAFSGEVLVAPKGNENDERPAEDEMVLEEGDMITTGGDSCAIISYADMSTFVMKPRSKVVLEAAPEKQSKVSLVAGNIWVNLKHIYETGHLDVTMNQAVAGTKGTTFIAQEDGTNSIIKVIEGLMSYKALASGEETEVGPGEMASTDESGKIEKTTFDAEEESAQWQKIQSNLSLVGSKQLSDDQVDEELPAETPAAKTSASETRKEKSTWVYLGILLLIAAGIFFAVKYIRKIKNIKRDK